MNDKELNNLLLEYRNKKPSDLQIQKWKNAISQELRATKMNSPRSIWLQLVACSVVSFFLGGMAFHLLQNKENSLELANNLENDATIEYVFHK